MEPKTVITSKGVEGLLEQSVAAALREFMLKYGKTFLNQSNTAQIRAQLVEQMHDYLKHLGDERPYVYPGVQVTKPLVATSVIDPSCLHVVWMTGGQPQNERPTVGDNEHLSFLGTFEGHDLWVVIGPARAYPLAIGPEEKCPPSVAQELDSRCKHSGWALAINREVVHTEIIQGINLIGQ